MKPPEPATTVLVSWIGLTDLRAGRGEDVGQGPVFQGLSYRKYDQVVLFSNFPTDEVDVFLNWIQEQTTIPIDCRYANLSSPTHFGEIYEFVVRQLAEIQRVHGADCRLAFHLSPGTPAMAAVWIIIAKTRFAAELIESSREHGVRTATVPFDIAAEFIPHLLRRPDGDLTRLSAGSPEGEAAFSDIIHRSPEMRRVIERAQKIAPRSVPVLIEGESGTGKELLGRAIHAASLRHSGPFIAVNCGAIPADLAESEFFGHKKGAFSGATASRKGHFQEADGGTLFLDEIGELSLDLQVKLLRAIQEKEIVPLGESHPVPVDIRIICATNRSLAKEASKHRFREDLYYRLAVAVIRLPSLRERKGDLTLLIDHLLEKINQESAAEPAWERKALSAAGKNLLLQHDWPGNIRELQNTLTRAAVWSSGSTLSLEDIQDSLLEPPPDTGHVETILGHPVSHGVDLSKVLADVARHYLHRALRESRGNRSEAARRLGLGSYQTFNNWLKRYGLDS